MELRDVTIDRVDSTIIDSSKEVFIVKAIFFAKSIATGNLYEIWVKLKARQ